jgi:hypothetical protein
MSGASFRDEINDNGKKHFKIKSLFFPVSLTGLPDFSSFFIVQTYQNGKTIANDHKLYQTAINYTEWPQHIINDHKI